MNIIGHKVPMGTVYIGRYHPWTKTSSKWANPFKIGKDGTREEVIQKYSTYLDNAILKGTLDISELKGKTLVCWCFPSACHGEVLLEKLKEIEHETKGNQD